MSLFHTTKKKRVVGTSVAPLFDKENIISSTKIGANEYFLFKNKSTSVDINKKGLSDFLIQAVSGNIVNKYNKFKKMADDGNYAYGAVNGDDLLKDDSAVNAWINEYITENFSEDYSISYNLFNEVYNYHFVWQKLKSTYGYSFVSNNLAAFEAEYGQPCYLVDAQIYYCDNTIESLEDAASIEPWGMPFTFGATYTRSRDVSRSATSWLQDNSLGKDYFNFKFELKLTTTQTIVTRMSDNVVLSDSTVSNGTEPPTYLTKTSTEVSNTITDDGTNYTQIIAVEHLYTAVCLEDFLAYEYSGDLDESIVLDERDANNTNPDAVNTLPGSVIANTTKSYFMVCFSYFNGVTTDYDIFTYEFGLGIIPELDNIFSLGLSLNSYYPKIYLRLNGKKLNNSEFIFDDGYIDSKKACKILGLDYVNLVQDVHENIGSLEKVKQMLVGLYCPMHEATKEQASYLIEYFKYLYDTSTEDSPTIPATRSAESVTSTYLYFLYDFQNYNLKKGKTHLYQDLVNKQSFSYAYIGTKLTTGVIGSVGHTTSEFHKYDILGDLDTSLADLSTYPFCYYLYKKQINSTQYLEVVVYNPSSTEYVERWHYTYASQDSENLLIPIDSEIAKQIHMKARELLFNQCLYLIIHTSYIVKTRWYQRDGFAYFLQFIAILLALPSGFTSLSIAEAIIAVIAAVIVTTVIKVTITVSIELLGLNTEESILFILVVAYFTGTFEFNGGTITALKTIEIANVALEIYQKILTEEYEDVLNRISEFETNASKQLELLEETKDKLNLGNYTYNPLFTDANLRMRFFIEVGEKPDEFFTKHVGNTNPGVALLDYANSYIAAKLTLPKPKY